eukprot:8958196-Alexandrium_andersonii.AAC.1
MTPNPGDEALQCRRLRPILGARSSSFERWEHLCMLGSSISECMLSGVNAGRYFVHTSTDTERSNQEGVAEPWTGTSGTLIPCEQGRAT